ncbi:hypothetical protein [Paenibacillus cremeus]|uniref:hypothetical protein n=1 Tax=Paenibacillus cremeus TaxID=2163881 RepID=UPI0016486D3D|nr:hypothetical protein [Paenibacillus cremeus]
MAYPRTKRLSFEAIRTNPVHIRTNLVTIKNMAKPYEDTVPDWKSAVHEQGAFDQLVEKIIETRLQGKPVIWSMGAHVIKNGLSRYIIEMVKHGILTHVSGNGATSIHDFELAFMGETSEDVARSIEDGSFGMWEETGRYMNEAVQQGAALGLGYGASLSKYLSDHPERFPHSDDCVFVQCQKYGVPYTCHISIGTDIIHQHPIVDFEALGAASGRDFEWMCRSVAAMAHGGVFLNFGSAISGPEMFLKALSLARNAGLPMSGITAANFDIVPVNAQMRPTEDEPEFYYRPRRNFIDRLRQIDGQGHLFHGLHQVTIPHLFEAVLGRMKERGISFLGGAVAVASSAEMRLGVERVLYPIRDRAALLRAVDIPHPAEPYWVKRSLPRPWDAPQFDEFTERWLEARLKSNQVLASLGGKVVGSGMTRYLGDLIERGMITHLAVVGACAFQDFELAAFGQTEEDEREALGRGVLGMWKEPGEWLNEALQEGYRQGLGYGESLIAYVEKHEDRFPYLDATLLGSCMKAGIPYTVHITIGTDAIQQHPDTDFAVHGGASGRDFAAYCHTVSQLEHGVFVNFGSTVTGPEVFLKALSIARNLQYPVHHITTANFDIIRLGDYRKKVGYEDWDYYYRPRKNIIHRPTSLGGKGFHFEGLHQETIPVLWQTLTLNSDSKGERDDEWR